MSGGAGGRIQSAETGLDLSRPVSDGALVADRTAIQELMSVSVDVDPFNGRTVENRAAAVERQLSKAFAHWKAALDVRLLRRELLQLLDYLDE